MSEARQVEPNLKTNVGPCQCGNDGCTAYGTYRVKPDRKGVLHTRNCDKAVCASCRGRRNRSEGARRQRKAAHGLGIPVSSLNPGHEELSLGAVRWEAKSGAQATPVWTRYLAAEAQSEAQRPIGDHRVFVACFEPVGSSDGLIVIRRSKLREAVAALAEQLGLIA